MSMKHTPLRSVQLFALGVPPCGLHGSFSCGGWDSACPTLCNPMDYIFHGTFQARILEWVTFPFSMGSSQPRDWTGVSCIAGGFFTNWATREALGRLIGLLAPQSAGGQALPCAEDTSHGLARLGHETVSAVLWVAMGLMLAHWWTVRA